ncbi:MAG: hypothetical protein IJ838_01395 [Paludibacteraceae bacterium]|nr:hypothetical protein [Paludibacteraceae bacterium]
MPEGKAITYGISDVIVAGQLSLLPEGTAWNKSQNKFMVSGAELTDSLMIVAPEPTIKYGIQIGDLELTSKNYENIEVGGSAGSVTYDPTENVLTLDNFIYNSNFGMVAVLDITTDKLTINLVGENIISSSDINTMRVEPQGGAQGTITFTGTGSLSLNSQYTAIELSRTVTMTVDGCQLDISGSEYGIYGRDAMISCMPETDEAASLVVTNGAALTVSGGTGGSINGLKSLVLDEDMAILSPEGAEFVTDCENFHYGVVKDGNYVRTAVEIGVRPADGIEDIVVDGVQNKKVLVDGVLYIVREGKLYTVEGTEVR